jgi:TolB-like protein
MLLESIACLAILAPPAAQEARLPAAAPPAKPSIAVLDFRVASAAVTTIRVGDQELSVSTETGILTDKLLTALAQCGRFNVIERQQLGNLLRELRLGESHLADPRQAPEVGRLLGADYLLLGSIVLLEEQTTREPIPYTAESAVSRVLRIGLDCRIVETATSRVVVAESVQESLTRRDDPLASARNPSTGELREQLYRTAVASLSRRIVDRLFPIRIANIGDDVLYLNRGHGSGLSVGATLLVYEEGPEVVDPDTGAVLGREEFVVARIRVVEILDKFAKATVIEWKRKEHTLRTGAICRPVEEKRESAEAAPARGRIGDR